MTLLARVPPGRAGRMWLHRRIATAERGRDQLDRKLRILVPDLQRLRIQAERRRDDWVRACDEADTWLLRAVLLGGEDALRHAAPAERAEVALLTTTTMGVSYPTDARVTTAPPPSASQAPGNAAIAPAAAAFRAALLAGVRAAAAEEAVRRVEAEVTVTRRRLRALDKRWLPSLRAALAALELSLGQAEQDDGIRLRRAAALSDARSPS